MPGQPEIAASIKSPCAITLRILHQSSSQADIGDDHFSYARNQDSITAEAALDGIYVLRTSVDVGDLDSPGTVSSYKALAPGGAGPSGPSAPTWISARSGTAPRTVCERTCLQVLSYYISWHMQARLAPLLFTDDDK